MKVTENTGRAGTTSHRLFSVGGGKIRPGKRIAALGLAVMMILTTVSPVLAVNVDVSTNYGTAQIIDGRNGWNSADGDNYLISEIPVTVNFVNHPFTRANAETRQNYDNFIIETVSSSSAKGVSLRADAYGWTYGDAESTPAYTVSYSWANWEEFQKICEANTNVSVTAQKTSNTEVTFDIAFGTAGTEQYLITYPAGVPSDLRFHLGADGAWIEVTSVVYGEAGAVIPAHVTVHDPSIVKDPKTGMYYVFGTHRGWAKSNDLIHWETFTNNLNNDDVCKEFFKKGIAWSSHGSSTYDVLGNLWAPDVIWNEEMGKWCMYMSVNGDKWYTSIALLTADSLDGDWTYVDTVVYSGFTNSTEAAETDYATVIGNNDVASRYLENRNGNHTYGMNAIDPCVLYDDGGNLWMTYGSWFGGIYMLKLNKTTGLRDYAYKYETVANESDAYQGIKLAGGQHVSGEASYIQKVGNYWYLFMTYGGLTATGGYNMRVFRSSDIKGPYVDYSGDDARYTTAGDNINGNIGNRVMSGYQWSYMKTGYVAQGHNSAFVDDDGKAYLVYHTRFNDGTEGHQVRVHQLFVNEDGWLVTAPFEYTGETLSSNVTKEEVAGAYEVLFHRLNINYGSLEVVTGENLTFNANGTITGDRTGTWEFSSKGAPYVTMKIGNVTYKGVFLKQQMEDATDTTWTFTILGSDEVSVWGYKYVGDGEELAKKAAENLVMPQGTFIDLELPAKGINNSTITWSSSNKAVLTDDGKITIPTTDTKVTLTGTFTVQGVSVTKEFPVTVYSPQTETGNKVLAKYFTGEKVNLASAVQGTYQYANPFYDGTTKGLQMYNGVSIEFEVEATAGADQWLADIIAFNTGAKGGLFFEGNSYLGYNGTGGIIDANLKNATFGAQAWQWGTNFLGSSAKVEIKMLPAGFEVYVNGQLAYDQASVEAYNSNKTDYKVPGEISIDSYTSILDYLQNKANYLNFGWGSFWDGGYKGTISNVVLSALPVEVIDTTGYLYYENYNKYAGKKGNETGWTSTVSDKLSVISAGDAHAYYLSYANPAASGNRGAYTVFPKEANVNKNFMVEADIILNSGGDRDTVFAITDTKHTSGNGNDDISEGYFLKLTVKSGSTTCTVAGTNYSFPLPKDTWIHVSVSVDEDGNVTAKVGDKELTGTSTATEALGGMFLLNGRSGSYSAVDNIAVHAHDWDEGKETKAPTCTEAGEKTYTCSVCEDTKTEEIETIDHTWDEGRETKAPTCTEAGEKTYTCTVCKKTTTEEIEATGHTESEPAEENRVEATCIKEGSYDIVVRCSVCNEILSTEHKTIPLAEHTWDAGNVTIEPNCTDEGEKVYSCTVCNTTKTETMEPLGHIASDGGTVVKEPTCTEDGILDFTCSRCHQGATQPIEKLGHDWSDWTIDKEAKCEEAGERSHICKRADCGEVEKEEIPALDHDWSDWTIDKEAKCEEAGEKSRICKRTGCGKVEKEVIPALGHTNADAVKEKIVEATCETEGSYDEVVYCSICKKELDRQTKTVPALDHDWGDWTINKEPKCEEAGERSRICKRTDCGKAEKEVIPALGHTNAEAVKENSVEAACETEGSYDEVIYCSICKKELSRENKVVPALGHTNAEAVKENNVEATCETAGSYDEVIYCSICKKELSRENKIVPALGHTNAEAVKENNIEAACETAGSYDEVIYCSICEKELGRETKIVPALGHDWSKEGTITKNPTCTENGEKTYTCSRCDKTMTEDVPATGHSYKEPVFIWSSDDSVTAEFTCTLCGETNSVKAEVEISTKNGIATHVASVKFEDKVYTDTKQIIALEEETDKRIVISDILNEIPDTLVEIGLSTKDKIIDSLSKVVVENGYSNANSAFYDIVLQTLENGGTTWKTVTPENFPKEGLTLTIPYPEGTNRFRFDFVVTHMFTVAMNGYKPGDVEILDVEKTDDGLKFTVSSLSPIGVSWVALDEEKETPTKQDEKETSSNPEETTASESTEAVKPSNSVTTPPKTGDSPLFGWLLICGMASCGLAVAVTNLGRNKKAGK